MISIALSCIQSLSLSEKAYNQSYNPSTYIWSVPFGHAINQQDYFRIASVRANAVELTADWGDLEPSPGIFDFSILDNNVR